MTWSCLAHVRFAKVFLEQHLKLPGLFIWELMLFFETELQINIRQLCWQTKTYLRKWKLNLPAIKPRRKRSLKRGNMFRFNHPEFSEDQALFWDDNGSSKWVQMYLDSIFQSTFFWDTDQSDWRQNNQSEMTYGWQIVAFSQVDRSCRRCERVQTEWESLCIIHKQMHLLSTEKGYLWLKSFFAW